MEVFNDFNGKQEMVKIKKLKNKKQFLVWVLKMFHEVTANLHTFLELLN